MKMWDSIFVFVILFGFAQFFSWSLYTVTVSQLPNIERAFGLTSSESGWLLTLWEVGYISCMVFVSYFASRAHIPRVMGASTMICGLSGFLFALPHFVAYKDLNNFGVENKTEGDTTNLNLCVNTTEGLRSNQTAELDAEKLANASRKTLAYTLLTLGLVLQGMSKSPCYPYSSQYIDDNGEKTKTGYYVGVMSSIGIFGLALGYGIGSGVSNIYVTLESTDMEPTDTRYIGAWWLALVAVSVPIILIAVPLFWFPRRMKSSQQNVVEPSHTQKVESTNIKEEMKRIMTTLLSILKSPVYTLSVMAACVQILSFACFLGFEPKYMTTQFSIAPWKVNIVLGVCSILAYSIGCLVGGFITKRWNMTPFRSLLMIILMFIAVVICMSINTFLGCGQPEIHNIPFSLQGQSVSLDCDCSESEFTPICGGDGYNYFSPCHAGCLNGTSKILANCSGIPEGGATTGLCESNCNMVWFYSVVKFLMNMIDAMASIPIFLVFLRSAGEENRSLALGLSAAITSIVGWLPGPIIGGKIIDGTCIFWNTASTSTKYCSFYDIEALRYQLHGLMIGLRVLSIILMCLALYKARSLPHWATKPVEKEGNEHEGQLMVEPGEKINNHD